MTTNDIIKNMMAVMERDLKAFYRATRDRKFLPNLEAFLKHWEKNFSPYILIKFDYRFNGQHLDISATYTPTPKYIVDIRKRVQRVLLDNPKYKYGF